MCRRSPDPFHDAVDFPSRQVVAHHADAPVVRPVAQRVEQPGGGFRLTVFSMTAAIRPMA